MAEELSAFVDELFKVPVVVLQELIAIVWA
jgi:hypothetical protein